MTTTDTSTTTTDAAGAGWYAYGALTTLLDGIDLWPREEITGLLRRVVDRMETDYGVVSR